MNLEIHAYQNDYHENVDFCECDWDTDDQWCH